MNKEFLDQLSKFLREQFHVSEIFCEGIEACEDQFDLAELIENSEDFKEIFAESLKNENEELQRKVSALESEVRGLCNQVYDLQEELGDKFIPKTLWEKEKNEIFISNQGRFTPTEFEMIISSETLKFIKINALTHVPEKEVICVSEKGFCMVGWLSSDDGDFSCESENELMRDVTHFAYIPKLK